MNRSALRMGLIVLLAAVFCASGTLAHAQGATSQTISGTVVDSTGAVIPGADVVAKHGGTGVTNTTVSNSDGHFAIPSLPIGTYTVTVTLQGFKTVVVNDVVLTSGHGADVKATMEVGGVSEQVTVASSSEIIQTQTAGVAQTVNAANIVKLPLTSRGAMDFVNLLPGVTTPNGNRQASINGLPRGAINITLDGVNIQDNTNKGTSGDDGFFAIVNPRLDAVEEVTVSTAAQGTDATADGAAQIKFVTRSGSNTFTGSAYEYFRSDKYNANTFFNNAKGVAKVPLKQNQTGFRVGGPIVFPGFDGHNKAFFFVNYEEFHAPSAQTRTRTVLNPSAQAGNYCYGSTCINVLKLGAASSSIDPTIGKLLSDINSATASTGSLTGNGNPNQQSYNFNIPVQSLRRYPTGRVDYNISQNHRISSSLNYQYFTDSPDTLNIHEPAFPGFPFAASQTSKRLSFGNSLRSTLGRNMVNEATVAYSWAPVQFFPEENAGMFTGPVANTQGFALVFPSVDTAVTGALPLNANNNTIAPSPQSRNATTLDITDNLTWLKGAHSITLGGQFSHYDVWLKNSTAVPSMTFGVQANDPATSLFTTANFPGASSNQLTAAQNLFALLTGRVNQISADARLDASGHYVYEGTGQQEGKLPEMAGYIQDQWRVRQNLTLNAGVRYDLQFPFTAKNSIYTFGDIANICGVSGAASDNSCNLFQPGVMPGQKPVFQQYTQGTKSFNEDMNNFGPSVGVAWTPQSRPGFLGKIMGPNDFVVRGGYARSFSRPAIGDYTAVFNTNPGVRLTNALSGPQILANAGQSGVLLFSNPLVQTPLPFPATPTYPLQPTSITNAIQGFDQNIQVPYSDTWQTGFTRSVGKDMALEVRYVGTHGYSTWAGYNYNQVNITSNGFLNEFRQAQANLQANIKNGNGNTFAYTGAPGTAPLPTFLGYFQGLGGAANAGNPANYTSTNFSNATFLGFLAALNPNPFGFLSTSTSSTTSFVTTPAFRNNGLAAGIPANLFVANPDLIGGATVQSNQGYTFYNGLQTEFRRRFSQGLQFQVSYAFDHAYRSQFLGFINGNVDRRQTGTEGDLTHQFKSLVTYDLPFGQGRRFGSSAGGGMDRLIGGWQVAVSSVIHSGQLVDFGNVNLVGMTKADVQKMIQLRFDPSGAGLVYMLPADVITNTINAFNVSATSTTGYAGAAPTGRYFAPANGPSCIEVESSTAGNAQTGAGKCGVGTLVVAGPLFQQHDITVAKRTKVVGHTTGEFRLEMLNAFNHPNFTPVGGIGNTTLSSYQLTALSGTNTSRIVQLVFRFNW